MVLDLTIVILIGSSVPNRETGVVLDLTFVILIGSSVPNTETWMLLDFTFVSVPGAVELGYIKVSNILFLKNNSSELQNINRYFDS